MGIADDAGESAGILQDEALVAVDAATPPLLVRVLGVPSVPARPALGGKELNLVVFLACHPSGVPHHAVANALWDGRAVKQKRLMNLVSDARQALGCFDDGRPILPGYDSSQRCLKMADGVITDVALLRVAHSGSAKVSGATALDRLCLAFELVQGPPFDGPGYEWAHHVGLHVAEASTLIEEVACRLVDLAVDTGELGVAMRAVIRGLRSLPGNELLYRLRMRVEHRAGNIPAVHTAYEELQWFLDGLDIGAQPSTTTTQLYRSLICGW